MRRLFSLILFGALLGMWFRPVPSQDTPLAKWMQEDGRLHVLATTKMCASVIESIGGDQVAVYTLIDEDLDPHTYQLVKGDAEKFRRADLIFANGLHLEHGRSLHQLLEKSSTLFLGDAIYNRDPNQFLPLDQGIDPHFWMDVSLFEQTIFFITEGLAEKDPTHKDLYKARSIELSNKFRDLDAKIFAKLQSVPTEKRYLVSSHDAFQYFARRYLVENRDWESRFLAPEGISPDGQIGPLDIQKIIDHVVKHKVGVVFAESNISKDSLYKIVESCRQQGVELRIAKKELYADSMGVDSYLEMMEHNGQVIFQELQDAAD